MRSDLAQDPKTHRIAFDLANSAFKRKDWREAAAYGEVAGRSEDEGVRSEAWLLVGESELKQKHWAPAAKAFEAVGAVSNIEGSVRFRALAGLGLAREEQKDLRGALAAYDAVAQKSPDASLRDWARERAGAVRARLGKPSPGPAKPKSG
jgi:tetratricopeptide (TPR) repeat protein